MDGRFNSVILGAVECGRGIFHNWVGNIMQFQLTVNVVALLRIFLATATAGAASLHLGRGAEDGGVEEVAVRDELHHRVDALVQLGDAGLHV